MRRAGRVVAEMHEAIRAAIAPGATTAHLDRVARDVLARREATSNFLGYHGYPAVICASVNDVVVHGIPDDRALAEGDILSIDCGAVVDGWHGDAAFTVAVGEPSPTVRRLLVAGEAALGAGIAALHDGGHLGDVGHAVQSVAEAGGFSVVRDFVGHAIGRAMHEDPEVPNVGSPGTGRRVRAGHVFALEPMLTTGGHDVEVDDDGWTVRTTDGGLAVHFEHTVAVTRDGPVVLTVL